MKRSFFPLLLTLSLGFALNVSAADSSAMNDHWKPLFDGTSLSGWKTTGEAIFKVEDGMLIGTQTTGKGGDIWHETERDNFELRVEYRMVWPGNSGFWFRCTPQGKGYQFDVLKYKNPEAYSGTLYCPGKMFITRNQDPSIEKKDGWNTARIRAQGDSITLWLNDKKVGTCQDDTHTAGHIGIQVHGGDAAKGMQIQVRKMDVRDL